MLDGKLPEVELAGARPLVDVEAFFAPRGLKLPMPVGSRPITPAPARDFAYVVQRTDVAGMAWRPLREVSTDDTLWEIYVELLLGGWEPPTRDVDVWAFGNEPEMTSRLAHLVAQGAKRATMAWVDAAEKDGSPLPREGGVSVVTDGFGHPRLVLRTTSVKIVPFDEVDADSAAAEGEGDLTYEDWRQGHIEYFTGEAQSYGLTFHEKSRIAVERFELLRVL
jgi:uncharacterized protein YhfF